MEKIWLRHLGLSTFGSLAFLFVSSAAPIHAADEIKTVIVDVEIPVKEGDLAGTKSEAEKQAFQSALDQSLSTTISPKERSLRLKNASNWIKTYRLEQEREEAGILKLRYRCEVIIPASDSRVATAEPTPAAPAPTPTMDGALPAPQAPVAPSSNAGSANPDQIFFFELSWRPLEVAMNSLSFLKDLEVQTGIKPKSVRMNRGSIVISVSAQSPDIVEAQIRRLLDSKVTLKSVTDPNAGIVQPQNMTATGAEPSPTGSSYGNDLSPIPQAAPLAPANPPPPMMGNDLQPIAPLVEPNLQMNPGYQEPIAPGKP